MRFHRLFPFGNDFRRGHIDEQWSYISRFGVGSDRVIKELLNCVNGQVANFSNPAITRQSRRIAHELSQSPMIGMLVLHQAWRENDTGLQTANDTGELNRVRGADFQMRVTI